MDEIKNNELQQTNEQPETVITDKKFCTSCGMVLNANGVCDNCSNNNPIKKKGISKKGIIAIAAAIVLVVATVSGFFLTNVMFNSNTTAVIKETPAILTFTSSEESVEYGDLYYKVFGKEKMLVASNVAKGQWKLLPNTQAIVYCDKDDTLFYRYPNSESVEIAKNFKLLPIAVFSEDEKSMLFSAESTLYFYTFRGEREKVAAGVVLYKLANNKVYYTNDNGEFYVWDSENGSEKIASSVSTFYVFNDSYFYTTGSSDSDYRTYVKLKNSEDVERIASENTYVSFSNSGYAAFYKKNTSFTNGEYIGDLFLYAEGLDEVKITSDISIFNISTNDKYLYYIDLDGVLYARELPEINDKTGKKKDSFIKELQKNEKIKLGGDVKYFYPTFNGKGILFVDENDNLYIALNNGEKAKISSDIYTVSDGTDRCIFYTNDGKLYINNKFSDIDKVKENNILISNDVDYYVSSEYGQNICYVDKEKQKLYLVSNKNKSEVFLENIEEFDSVYYNNLIMYDKALTVSDIAGCYVSSDGEYYINILSDETYETCTKDGIVTGSWNFDTSFNKYKSSIRFKKDGDTNYNYYSFEINSEGKKYLYLDEDDPIELISIAETEMESYKIETLAKKYISDGVYITPEDIMYSADNYDAITNLRSKQESIFDVRDYSLSSDKKTIWLKLKVTHDSKELWFPVSAELQ